MCRREVAARSSRGVMGGPGRAVQAEWVLQGGLRGVSGHVGHVSKRLDGMK